MGFGGNGPIHPQQQEMMFNTRANSRSPAQVFLSIKLLIIPKFL